MDIKQFLKNNLDTYIIIAGPTGSGKSKLAVELALFVDGEIINADSVQLYSNLRILTARPNLSNPPHHLYGILPYFEQSTAAWWSNKAAFYIKDCFKRQKIPILVGGTGFYLKALTDGISKIPSIPNSVRTKVYLLYEQHKNSFYEYVLSNDPLIDGKIAPNDTQRLMRALEVNLYTNKSIFKWHTTPIDTPLSCNFLYYFINPDRKELCQTLNNRFFKMIEKGALNEAKILLPLEQSINPTLLRAIGVKELFGYLKNECSLNEAIENAQLRTCQYAKRQVTWFKNQVKNKTILRHATLEELVYRSNEIFTREL
ncbi:MAG: tRNA (adenosine(37)-N6)-dimethylallyltransferase MiaA [Alphaproteobacteria bacterium]